MSTEPGRVGERAVATVNGKVIGIPAVVDNLGRGLQQDAVRRARTAAAGPDWTWQEFVADAKKLTNPAISSSAPRTSPRHRGHRPAPGGALLWESGRAAARRRTTRRRRSTLAAGLASLNTLRTMAGHGQVDVPDPSDSAYSNLFNSGKIGMPGHRAVGPCPRSPTSSTGCRLRAAYHRHQRRPPRPSPARTIGHLQQQPGLGGAAAEQFLLWLTAPQCTGHTGRCRPATCPA